MTKSDSKAFVSVITNIAPFFGVMVEQISLDNLNRLIQGRVGLVDLGRHEKLLLITAGEENDDQI